jgi:CheY-like chemotaxis protein
VNKLRIFIVDDDREFSEGMGDVLELHGHEVQLALSGEEAVERLRKEDFDVTFMDVKLPGKNGVESFMEIRQTRPEAKVVMMTGYSVEQLLEQAVENGAWEVLRKPLDMDEVLKILKRIGPCGVVLVADDDPDFVEGIRQVLQERGYRVLVVTNGEDVVKRVTADGIDVLILDLRMPVLTGLEAYQKLKAAGCTVPTIIVTAYARANRSTPKS